MNQLVQVEKLQIFMKIGLYRVVLIGKWSILGKNSRKLVCFNSKMVHFDENRSLIDVI